MVYNVIIKPEAEIELFEFLNWYKSKGVDLPVKFYKAVHQQLMIIEKTPFLFQIKYKEFRVAYTNKFNYGIHFTIELNTIYIHAFLHSKRQPLV
ncbi:MAG: plasmid stabilization system protein [Flavobacteriaceae bacterium]|nr:MAG: plasmid stabilization system protein [Flavobacteriaceae bacterium]